MKIDSLKLHRKISWLVAIFSLFMIIIVSLRGFLEIFSFYPFLHLSVEWILIGLLILHCILAQKFFKLWFRRIFKGIKNERTRPIYIFRLVQLITNRIIIILAALVVISGLGYYDWYANTIGTIIPFSVHRYYDFFLILCIIIHIGVGFKFMFMRRKISQKTTNIFIVLFIFILISIVMFLFFFT